MRTALSFAALLIATAPAWGASEQQAGPTQQAWKVRHQPDRFKDRIIMSAYADADHGPARLSLYCDTDNGFRVFLTPNQALMPEGPARFSIRIDDDAPVSLTGNAFGDKTTDAVTFADAGPIEAALAGAHHVDIHYIGGDGASGDVAFTFTGLAADKPMVMKLCPVRQPRPR